MKIYSIPFFCFFLVACGAPPKINYPTGSNRVPVNENYVQLINENVTLVTEDSVKPKPKNLTIKESL